jgi:hypothetical protein
MSPKGETWGTRAPWVEADEGHPPLVAEQGIGDRLQKATEQMNFAVSSAASCLACFAVTEAGVKLLVEAAIEDAQADIRKGVFA